VKIKILIPNYNDWQSVFKLLENIDLVIAGLEEEVSVIIVNDASTEQRPEISLNLNNLKSIQVINMKENRGHARCNAAGLKYINEREDVDYVIPMDGDGEDRPEEIRPLIEKAKEYPDTVITANRIKRSEGLLFKFCYLIHKYLTFVFTGQSIKFGNYTCLTKSAVDKMSKEAATWSSFSGSLSKVVKDLRSVPSIRGSRYFGPSKMSFINLLKHSLSIVAVYKFTVLIRSIIFLAVYIFLVSQYISVVTFIPIALVVVMIISVFVLSGRENITELNSSLENINNIDNLK
jgi:glycosyltransferase involved in cell wall biosynthesis|tara:strand:+ start:430 stop:1299 length:870 start_codon:yes stop_codon:yes gene_type:complete